MDKSTLSNYGWIVIAVLVLAVMIALATPFGQYVENGVRSTTQGLFDTSEKAMNVVGMSAGDGSFESATTKKGTYSIAHSAYWSNNVPQNTLETFKLAKEDGFKYVETDIRFTSDGIPVLLHDKTINGTARNIDGSELTETINITDITFDEVRKYNFGYCGHGGYLDKGITIPSFEEFIIFCKENDLHPYLDVDTISEQQVEILVKIINDNNMQNNVSWTSADYRSFSFIAKYNQGDLCYTVTQIDDNVISVAKNIQNQVSNKVFISSNAYNKDDVELVKTSGLPMIAWTINDKDILVNLDPYISAIMTDRYNLDTFVYDESDWEIVKELSSSDLKYNYICTMNNNGFSQKNHRAAYCKFDIPAEFGYIYKVEFTSTIENVQVDVQACNENAISSISDGKTPTSMDAVNTGYKDSGIEYEVHRLRNGYKIGAIRLTFKDSNETGADDYITSVTISRKQIQ